MSRFLKRTTIALTGSLLVMWITTADIYGQNPSVVDRNLVVRTVVDNLVTPISISFLGTNDFFVLEKDTGKVKRVVGGMVQGTVIDLAVNNNTERGLLGIALHPAFPANPGVYLFWLAVVPLPLTMILSCRKKRNARIIHLSEQIATMFSIRWKELGRFVKKGEKALTLCMPLVCRRRRP
jgi:hypothetical protein